MKIEMATKLEKADACTTSLLLWSVSTESFKFYGCWYQNTQDVNTYIARSKTSQS